MKATDNTKPKLCDHCRGDEMGCAVKAGLSGRDLLPRLHSRHDPEGIAVTGPAGVDFFCATRADTPRNLWHLRTANNHHSRRTA